MRKLIQSIRDTLEALWVLFTPGSWHTTRYQIELRVRPDGECELTTKETKETVTEA